MTATNSGLVGGDELGTDIKFIWNYAGNCLTNQHGDINMTHEILVDESKCEFILVWDTVMTDSAKYADILLPDAMRSEQMNLQDVYKRQHEYRRAKGACHLVHGVGKPLGMLNHAVIQRVHAPSVQRRHGELQADDKLSLIHI